MPAKFTKFIEASKFFDISQLQTQIKYKSYIMILSQPNSISIGITSLLVTRMSVKEQK
jgi:hypothetical protein